MHLNIALKSMSSLTNVPDTTTRSILKCRIKKHQNNVKIQHIKRYAVDKHCWGNYYIFKFCETSLNCKTPQTTELNILGVYFIHKSLPKLCNKRILVPTLYTILL